MATNISIYFTFFFFLLLFFIQKKKKNGHAIGACLTEKKTGFLDLLKMNNIMFCGYPLLLSVYVLGQMLKIKYYLRVTE